MATILFSELHEKVSFLTSLSTGKTFFIQDYDGYMVEDDDGEVVFESEEDIALDIILLDSNIKGVQIGDTTYYPYKSELVNLA